MRLLTVLIAIVGTLIAGMPAASAAPGDPGAPLALGPRVEFEVTPDSQDLVYTATAADDSGSVLFARPMAGGSRVRLSPRSGRVLEFEVTPDSAAVVYVEQTRGLRVVPLDGGTPTLLDGTAGITEFRLTADGARVVYLADGRLRSAATAGGAPVDLDLETADCCLVGELTPDSATWVTWTTPLGGTPSLRAVPLDGSPSTELAGPFTAAASVSRVRISADGEWVVYRLAEGRPRQWELHAVRVDGIGSVRLNDDLPAGGDVTQYAIAPDSTTVVYRADQRQDDEHQLWAVPIEGGPLTRLNRPLAPGGDVKRGRVSARSLGDGFLITPDSSTVVYRSDERADRVHELFAVGISGRPRKRLTHSFPSFGDVDGFAISPDGQRVVFRADQRTNDVKQLFAAPLTDGPLTNLTPDLVAGGDVRPGQPWALGAEFVISPDSRRVLYVADQDVDNVRQARVVRMSGRGSTVLNGPMHPDGDAGGGRLGFSSDSVWAGFFADDLADVGRDRRARVA